MFCLWESNQGGKTNTATAQTNTTTTYTYTLPISFSKEYGVIPYFSTGSPNKKWASRSGATAIAYYNGGSTDTNFSIIFIAFGIS